jgi:hypothetical protein
MPDLEIVPSLGPGETGQILKRFMVASAGPWAIGKAKGDPGTYVFPAANLDQPIAYVFDSVADNGNFVAHAWEDQRRLLASVLRYKGTFGELARQIRESARTDDGEGERGFLVRVPEALLFQIEEFGKL